MTRPVFRNGFLAGALVAVILGLYLFQLWQSDRQVHLHSIHLAAALEQKDWSSVEQFLAEDYRDQWGHDRTLLLTRLRAVLHYARNPKLDVQQTITVAAARDATWKGRIMLQADDNEVAAFIKARVNTLEEPFELQWRQQSWKPWDWKLVRVSNTALELPSGGGF